MEDRVDVFRGSHAPHGEVLMPPADLGIAVPHRRLLRVVEALAVRRLDVGEVLADRQHLLVEQLHAARHVVVEVVAVGRLRRVDVPVGRRIARLHHVQHFLQRRGDDGAAGLGAAEERVLVDFGGRAGVADEDQVHLAIVAGEEHVQQHEEALGEVLERLGHGRRRVHQAEHHRLGGRLGHPVEAIVLQIDRVDVGDAAPQSAACARAQARSVAILSALGRIFCFGGIQLRLQAVDLGLARTAQGQSAPEALAHGTRMIEPGRRTVGGEPGTRRLRRLQVLEPHLDQVRQLEIVEEEVEELFLGQGEGELVLALAVGAALAAATASAALRLGDLVADLVLLVARQHVVARARVAARRKRGLAQALGADGDLLGAFRLRDLARLQRILDGLADLRLGTAKEPLAIAEALGFRIETPVDDLHETLSAKPAA